MYLSPRYASLAFAGLLGAGCKPATRPPSPDDVCFPFFQPGDDEATCDIATFCAPPDIEETRDSQTGAGFACYAGCNSAFASTYPYSGAYRFEDDTLTIQMTFDESSGAPDMAGFLQRYQLGWGRVEVLDGSRQGAIGFGLNKEDFDVLEIVDGRLHLVAHLEVSGVTESMDQTCWTAGSMFGGPPLAVPCTCHYQGGDKKVSLALDLLVPFTRQ